VLSGGRGKAGGVKFAATPEEAGRAARGMLAMRINGFPVKQVLVAERLKAEGEFYVGLTIDRASRSVQCVMSAAGGVDIEETSKSAPEKIVTAPVSLAPRAPVVGEGVLMRVFGKKEIATMAADAVAALSRLLYEKDCSLVEVNPYILTRDNKLVAADAKIIIDDNALYKHPDLEALRNSEEYGEGEMAAQRAGLSYVGLDGDIGCMVNGAGLAMATMDLIKLFGGRPANFLDVGGSSNPQKILAAFELLLAGKTVKVICVNIFGGITRCDDIAQGILLAKRQLGIGLPLVVRLTGTNGEKGRAMLADAAIHTQTDMVAAVKKAVELAGAAP